MKSIRLGVDVGGTFTKAVAVGSDADGHSLLAQAIVPTTHTASEGVALGVVQALQAILDHPDVPAADVTLVAHSTTQAVNALLEGDTATVGIVGMGGGRDGADALRRTQVENIEVAPGKPLRTHHVFIDTSAGITRAAAEQAVDRLIGLGAQAIVASGAFSVDEPEYELLVLDVAADRGVPGVAGHQLSGVYGLEIRTLTAAINASLVPQMLQTAELVERSLRRAGIHAPLMVMRGDGGLTDLATLQRRPILTLFSGPAASLAGALLSGGVVNGVFLEVGGTSSNLGIVRGGQPETRYVWVMNHPTCVRSLDVRVQGVAGGSLARIGRRKIVDVGPRSAHIAGLPYASLSTELADIPAADLSLELIAPRPGDPADYAVVQAADGRRWALTVTCAANALGKVAADVYAAGSSPAALRGFEVMGQALGCSGQAAAQQMLDLAAERVAAAVKEMSREYKLRRGAFQLSGGGGGAGALVPAVAERLGVPYRLVERAPVISSLGDALASVREEVERAVGDATVAESLAQEAESAAIRAGAAPESVQVVIERDEQRGILRAVATGNLPLTAPTDQKPVDEATARLTAAQTADVDGSSLELLLDTPEFRIYRAVRRWLRRTQTVVVDRRGAAQLVVSGGEVLVGTADEVARKLAASSGPGLFGNAPTVRLVVGSRLLDLSSDNGNDLVGAVLSALGDVPPDTQVAAIVER